MGSNTIVNATAASNSNSNINNNLNTNPDNQIELVSRLNSNCSTKHMPIVLNYLVSGFQHRRLASVDMGTWNMRPNEDGGSVGSSTGLEHNQKSPRRWIERLKTSSSSFFSRKLKSRREERKWKKNADHFQRIHRHGRFEAVRDMGDLDNFEEEYDYESNVLEVGFGEVSACNTPVQDSASRPLLEWNIPTVLSFPAQTTGDPGNVEARNMSISRTRTDVEYARSLQIQEDEHMAQWMYYCEHHYPSDELDCVDADMLIHNLHTDAAESQHASHEDPAGISEMLQEAIEQIQALQPAHGTSQVLQASQVPIQPQGPSIPVSTPLPLDHHNRLARISRLPIIRIGHDSTSYDLNHCCICLQEYAISDVLKVLPCCHSFHSQCARRWLYEKNNCPLCLSAAY